MQNKVCCCFGHRNISGNIDRNLENTIEQLINEDGVNVFMSGNRGNFDFWFAMNVHFMKRKYPDIRLILVEPYPSKDLEKNKDFYKFLYDSIIIPEESASAHYRAAIPIRNQWMVDNSDIVVAYIRRDHGGAYNAVKYAEEKNKNVIYIDPPVC